MNDVTAKLTPPQKKEEEEALPFWLQPSVCKNKHRSLSGQTQCLLFNGMLS